jgi:hypothetical protein
MDYSEELYHQLLKMRALGKKNYDEERYSQSLVELRKAEKALDKASDAYEENPTDENEEIVFDRDDEWYSANERTTWLREIMEGKRSDPKMTDTMYEIHGYKMKEESDKFFSEWSQRVCPEGYWMPGMKR